MTHTEATAIVDAWRQLPDNEVAVRHVALVDGLEADPDGYTAAVAALVRGIPRIHADLAELINITGRILDKGPRPAPPRGIQGDVPPLDALDFLRRP